MKTIIAGVVLICLGVACAERTFPLRSLAARAALAGGNQNYWLLGAPRKGSNSIQAVQVPLSLGDFADDDGDDDDNYEQQGASSVVVQDDDDDDESSFNADINGDNFGNDDDDEEDTDLTGNVVGIISLDGGNTFFSNRKDNDGIAKMEEREIDSGDDDEDLGEPTIFLPRGALEKIPNGSILALVDDSDSTGRAVRGYYRRIRRTGPTRRRRVNNQSIRHRRGGNIRRRRPTIRVIRPVTNSNRVVNKRRRPSVIRL